MYGVHDVKLCRKMIVDVVDGEGFGYVEVG